jgi:hypothetical protein
MVHEAQPQWYANEDGHGTLGFRKERWAGIRFGIVVGSVTTHGIVKGLMPSHGM